MILQLKIFFAFIRYIPLIIIFKNSSQKKLIILDIDTWLNGALKNKAITYKLVYLLLFEHCFRNLFYFRCPKTPHIIRNLFCNPDKSFYIADYEANHFNEIAGGGIRIIHGFGTRIRAKKIGYGCSFRQLTTIGTKAENAPLAVPIIKNNVSFGANVTVIGDITIGENAIIGAGSVVVKNVPDNAIVAGNPAKVIKYRSL